MNGLIYPAILSDGTTEKHCQWLDSGGESGIRANLTGVDLSYSILRCLRLPDAILIGVSFWGSDLSGSDLRRSDLKGADLRFVNLENATLEGADLTGANIRGAWLRGANLMGSNLTGVNLETASLLGAIY